MKKRTSSLALGSGGRPGGETNIAHRPCTGGAPEPQPESDWGNSDDASRPIACAHTDISLPARAPVLQGGATSTPAVRCKVLNRLYKCAIIQARVVMAFHDLRLL